MSPVDLGRNHAEWRRVAVVIVLLVCSVSSQGNISHINGFSPPYHFGEFQNGMYAATTVSCALETGVDCHISIQLAGRCESNVLTLPNYFVRAGANTALNMTRGNAVALGSLYELCVHPNFGSTFAVGTGFYYAMLPALGPVLGVSPATLSAPARPCVTVPYQPQGMLPISTFASYLVSIQLPATSGTFPASLVGLRAALLPTCSFHGDIADYLLHNGTASAARLAYSVVQVAANRASLLMNVTYSQLHHAWTMLERNIGGMSSGTVREARLCLGAFEYQRDPILVQTFSASSGVRSFPIDVGISFRLATNFRLAGERVFRDEDSTASARQFYLLTSISGTTPLVFDRVTPSSQNAADLASSLAAESRIGRLRIEVDLRDTSFPCDAYTHDYLSTQNAASLRSANPWYLPMFAKGTYSPATSLVSWNVAVNRSFPGNTNSAFSARGGAQGLLCIYVEGVPIVTSHLVGSVFSAMIEEPIYIPTLSAVSVRPEYGGDTLSTMMVASVLRGTDVTVLLNFSAYSPPTSSLRFTVASGPCGGVSSVAALSSSFGVVDGVTRFVTLSGTRWLTGTDSLLRLCISSATNTNDAFYFQDASVPIGFVVAAFSSVGALPGVGGRFFIPLNAAIFYLPFLEFQGGVNVYFPGRLQLTFAARPSECQGRSNASTAVTGWTRIGSGATQGHAALISSQFAALAVMFPVGAFAATGCAVLCFRDSQAYSMPTSFLPLVADGVCATFFRLFVAGQSMDAPLASLRFQSGFMGSLVGVFVDPQGGLNIPLQLFVRTNSPATGWVLSSVLTSVRLSSNASTCRAAEGSGGLTLAQSYASTDAVDVVRVTGVATMTAAGGILFAGRRKLCVSTALPELLDDEVLFSQTSFDIGIVSIAAVNGYDVSSGPNTTTFGVVQYVNFQWEVLGSGFTSVSEILMRVGPVFGSALTVTDNTNAVFSFTPTTPGVQQVNVSFGNTLRHLSYNLVTIDVIGIESVGFLGSNVLAMFAGAHTVFPLTLTSQVSSYPLVCISDTVDSATSRCSCVPLVTATVGAGNLSIDLRGTNISSVVGVFSLCFRHSSPLFYSTQQLVHILPAVTAIGGTLTESGADSSLSVLRGTSPTLLINLASPWLPQTVGAASLSIALVDILSNATLGGSTCGNLSNAAGSIAKEAAMFVPLAIGESLISSVMPLSMTTSDQVNDTRRLCAAIVTTSSLNAQVPLRFFTTDIQVVLEVGTLFVNDIAINTGSNTTLPIFAQGNTTLNVTLPSFVAQSSFLYFGVASASCSSLPLSSSDIITNVQVQRVNVTNITLNFPSVGSTTAGLVIPSGILDTSNNVQLCARWLESQRYSFTGVLFSTVNFRQLDKQVLSAAPSNASFQYLSAPAGIGVMRNATRAVLLEGDRLESACFRLMLSTQDVVSACSDTAAVAVPASQIQSTPQFEQALVVADYTSMCLVMFQITNSRCVTTANVATMPIAMPFSVLAFDAFDVIPVAATRNQQQTELQALVGIPMTTTLVGVEYSVGSVATYPFIQLAGVPVTGSTSCDRDAFALAFDVEEVTTTANAISLGFVSNIAEEGDNSQYSICLIRNTSLTRQVILSLGMTLLVTNLVIGGAATASNQTISLTTGQSIELSAAGANLNSLLLYAAITDAGSCNSAALQGTNGVGVERTPQTAVSCSSSKGSVAFSSKATNTSVVPLMVCVAAIPASTGKAIPYQSLRFYDVGVQVIVAESLQLEVVTQPSSEAGSDKSLAQPPVLGIKGSGENSVLVQNLPEGISITARWMAVSPPGANSSEACEWCSMKTVKGGDYLLTVTSATVPTSFKYGFTYILAYTASLESTDTRLVISPVNTSMSGVKKGKCPVTHYGQLYSTECAICKSSANCDGDVAYTMKSSYWRPNAFTDNIYDCGPPYGSSQCIEGTSTGTCTQGHTGARCTVCEPGYGKSFDTCVECGSYISSLTTVIAFVLAFIAFLIAATFSSVTGMDDERETKHLPMLIKLLSSHLAVASTVGEFNSQFPDLLNSMFSGMRSTGRPNPRFASLDCSLSPTVYQSFLFLVLIPLPTLVFVLAASFIVHQIHRWRDKAHEERKALVKTLEDRIHKDALRRHSDVAPDAPKLADAPPTAHHADDEKPEQLSLFGVKLDLAVENGAAALDLPAFDGLDMKTDAERQLDEELEDVENYERAQKTRLDTKTLFLLTLVVVLLFAYPTIVEQSLNMLKCDSIEYGFIQPDQTFTSDLRKLYFYDRSLDCNSNEHKVYSLAAYLSVIVYGLGIPLASIGLIMWFRKRKGPEYTNRLFVFLVCGYDEDRWWWETVILWRKLALAFILVFVDEQRLQTYFALWILMTALALQMWLEPYDEVNLDRLATASLCVVIITLNFSLLYDYLPATSADPVVSAGNVAVTVFLFVINAVVVLVLVLLILLHGIIEIQYQISANQKLIRKILPVPLQQCLFAMARRPVIMFRKILKKRERQRERKNRLQHIIGDAENEVIEVVQRDDLNATRAISKGTRTPGLRTPGNITIDRSAELEKEKKVSADLRKVLFELVARHEELLKKVEAHEKPEVAALQAKAELQDMQKMLHIINRSPQAGLLSPGVNSGLRVWTPTPTNAPLIPPVLPPGEIVVEDLTELPPPLPANRFLQSVVSDNSWTTEGSHLLHQSGLHKVGKRKPKLRSSLYATERAAPTPVTTDNELDIQKGSFDDLAASADAVDAAESSVVNSSYRHSPLRDGASLQSGGVSVRARRRAERVLKYTSPDGSVLPN